MSAPCTAHPARREQHPDHGRLRVVQVMTPDPAWSLPLIDPDRPSHLRTASCRTPRGEGMTEQPLTPAPHRETGTEDAHRPTLLRQAESSTSLFDLPALNSMRRTASASRPSGRYAVGLRPSLDPDAYFGAPSQDQEARRTSQKQPAVVLTGPAPSGMTCEIA